MTLDRSLSWVQSNRRRAERATPVGQLVAKMAESMSARGEAEEVAVVMTDLVDDEFRKHCRVAGQRNGPWVVNVDAPALVYPMRLRWSARLREALSQAGGRRLGRELLFAYGSAGVDIPERGNASSTIEGQSTSEGVGT